MGGTGQGTDVDVSYAMEEALETAEHALQVEGDLDGARRWYDLACQDAAASGDGEALARAALGLGGLWVHEHRTAADGQRARAWQRRALAQVGAHAPLGVRLRVRLRAEDDYRDGRHEAIMDALAEARACGDPVAVAEALNLAHHCLMDPAHARLRLELARELIGQAVWTDRRSDLLMGMMWHTVDLFLAADPHAERALTELSAELAARDHRAVGFVVAAIEVMLTIRSGRLDRAEELAAGCAARGREAGDADAEGWYGAQLAAIRWYQGRIGELAPFLAELVRSPTLGGADYAYFPAAAVAAAASGDHRLARAMLARMGDLRALPRTKSWLAALHGVAEAAFLLDDAATAATVHDLMLPYAHLPVMASLGVACFGSARHALGMAALATGRLDLAVEHLDGAVRANLALGHWPAATLSRWRLGQALALRGDSAARGHLAQAELEAAELGMVLPSAGGRGREPVACRRHGRGWRLSWAGRSVLVADSVGMRHLAVLLANPGREIPALDLAAGPEAERGHDDSYQPVLDEQARRAYKERLAQLQADIDEYEAHQDLERAAAARAEHEWLVAELAAVTGLGGRTRHFTGGHERARIAVTKAIRRALDRVAELDPAIGDELRATVHTGRRCSYHPS